MSRLTKRVNGEVWWYTDGNHYPATNMDGLDTLIAMNKLEDYEDLEDEGRLLKLPCAVGDEVFVVWEKHRSGRYERGVNTGKFRLEDIPLLGKKVFIKKQMQKQDY